MKNIASSLFVFALSGILWSCQKEEVKVEIPLRPVQYSEVTYSGRQDSRTFSGTAKSEKEIKLSFRSSGIVTDLDMKLGQKVRKGQQLGRLDNVQARLAYEQAVSALNSAESQMNTAKLALDRTRKLYEKGSASLSDYEQTKNNYRTAKENHESAIRSVNIQEEQITYGYLKAPTNGEISEVNVELDENVSAGQIVGKLNAGQKMEVYLGLPESVINQVKTDMPVEIRFSSLSEGVFKGIVSEVSPALNPNTSTYPVRIKIENQTDRIKSGMAAAVRFQFNKESGGGSDLIILPPQCVGEDSKGKFVFIIEEVEPQKGVAKKKYIEIGRLSNAGFEIVSGLQPGQKIATAGLQTLLDNQEVKLN